ncbi:AAA family ATPase [Flagellimonas eckloniae]|uniref:AAA family ATPase n=1 Tax=Flagellimonas eckloniae TaxID=346185 RepID=UPI0006DCCF54|nr:AAA family ATPase [Allomuricauda eckloniae]
MDFSVAQMHRIADEVARQAKKTSQAKVANRARVSAAIINQIINKKWSTISVDMFKSIEVNLRMDFSWKSAPTSNLLLLTQLIKNAHDNSISIAISENAGRGKTHAYRQYVKNHDNVIHLECANSWTKKSYMKHLMAAAGLNNSGTLEFLVETFIKKLKGMHRPIVIIDQFDKLKDSQMDLFMDFYNELDGYCAFVLSGVKALEKRVMNGVNRDKIGYAEMYSRIGRKFIGLDPISKSDVRKVCNANDIFDAETIGYIYANSDGDMRRVKRDIEIQQQIMAKAINEITVQEFQEVGEPA